MEIFNGICHEGPGSLECQEGVFQFQVVSQSVIDIFLQLAHLRVFQSYFFVSKPSRITPWVPKRVLHIV